MNSHSRAWFLAAAIVCVWLSAVVLAPVLASAQAETILYNFKGNGSDGADPISGLIRDTKGNFYGTTTYGGTHGKGTAYELSLSGGTWKDSVLWNFGGVGDGAYPYAGLWMDLSGVLWGTTDAGGLASAACPSGCGAFYTIVGSKGVWVESALFSFPGGGAGYYPINLGSLVEDLSGNFYGTAYAGGAHNQGAVYEFSFSSSGTTETVIYSFDTTVSHYDGVTPEGALVMDSFGNLYGTTYYGGTTRCNSTGCGTVFELSPPVPPSTTWTETILWKFQGGAIDGSFPAAGLIMDSAGNLYGTTTTGGLYGYGTAFELSPSILGGWSETKIYNFGKGQDSRNPWSALVMDSEGNLYGTSKYGGAHVQGTVFKLTPNLNTWNNTVLHSFPSTTTDGSNPLGGLYRDSNGHLFGTTYLGGADRYGTVFEVVP